MASIEVKVTKGERIKFMNPAEEQRFVISKLKDKGVPFGGEALLVGLESGTLTISHDLFDDSFTYTYTR